MPYYTKYKHKRTRALAGGEDAVLSWKPSAVFINKIYCHKRSHLYLLKMGKECAMKCIVSMFQLQLTTNTP